MVSADELTDGRYIMVTDTGYAPGVLEGTWVTAEQIAADGESGIQPGDSIQENENVVWELTVTSAKDAADLTVTLKDKNGTFIAPKGGNNNGIKASINGRQRLKTGNLPSPVRKTTPLYWQVIREARINSAHTKQLR